MIVLKFSTPVCFCTFVFFSNSFSNYEQKTGKKGTLLKEHAVHSFPLGVNFLSRGCLKHYSECPIIFLNNLLNQIFKKNTKNHILSKPEF